MNAARKEWTSEMQKRSNCAWSTIKFFSLEHSINESGFLPSLLPIFFQFPSLRLTLDKIQPAAHLHPPNQATQATMSKRSNGNSKSASGPQKKSSRSKSSTSGGGSKSRSSGGKPKMSKQQQQQPVVAAVPTETPAPPLDEHTLAMMLGGGGGGGVGDPFATVLEANGGDVDAAIAAMSTPAPANGSAAAAVHHLKQQQQQQQQQESMASLLLTAQTSNVTGYGNGGVPPAAALGTMVHTKPPALLHHHQGGGTTEDDVKENDDGIVEGKGAEEDEDAEEVEEEEEEEEEEADLNWDAITRFDPARTDVPAYLAARTNFDAAKMALGSSIDQYHASLEGAQGALLNIPANIHNQVDETLQGMEDQLRRGFVSNAEKRETIETTLHKSAETARALFDGLLMRMAGVGGGAAGSGNACGAGGGTAAGMAGMLGGLGGAGGGPDGGK